MAYNGWYPPPHSAPLYGTPGYVQWFPQAPPHSAGMVPPQQAHWGGQAYTDAYGASGPVAAARSEKYPDLNPILAIDTTKLRFDIKHHPQSEILASTWYAFRTSPAKAPSSPSMHHPQGTTTTSFMRLISPKFPWSIDIKLHPGTNITCGVIWEAIYHALQEPLQDSEWGMIVMDKKMRERVEGAMKKRMEAAPSSPPGPKRIDFLGDCTLFKGLERDGEFSKLRAVPGEGVAHETWVLRITS